MVFVAQLVRALDCESRGRGFKSRHSPQILSEVAMSPPRTVVAERNTVRGSTVNRVLAGSNPVGHTIYKYQMRKWLKLFESTNSECDFTEVAPGEWWYLLDQMPNYDDEGEDHRWDWREDAIAEGPFASYDEAREHLRNNHPNPGGHSYSEYHPDFKPDAVMLGKMEEARNRAKSTPSRGYSPFRF